MSKIRQIRKLKVNNQTFSVSWPKKESGGSLCYESQKIRIGLAGGEQEAFDTLCHELKEICAVEHHCRYDRTDVDDDYLFNYDHRQHTAMCALFSSLLWQFIYEKPSASRPRKPKAIRPEIIEADSVG